MAKILKNFYCIEGIDGSGKSSIIKKIKEICKDNHKYYFTYEPSDGKIGKLIREELMNFENPINLNTLAYLYAADRNEHLFGTSGIIEILKEKKKVITDRYLFSSNAYQENIGKELNKNFPLPEKLFFIKIDPKIAYERILKGRKGADIFENEQRKLEDINSRYLKVIKDFENEIEVIYLDNSNEKNLEQNALKVFNLIKF